jgi:hypothetical protein
MSTATIPTVYATDEDIALRASADFTLLCPRDQKVASGSDGVFSPATPWLLTSATANFQALGVAPGQVVQIQVAGAGQCSTADCLVVASTAPGSVTLRRKGQSAAVGMPPGPSTGVGGVRFQVLTFGPQIALAADDINRRFGITNGLYPGRSPSVLSDSGELRDAVVLTVLYRRYLDVSREVAGPSDSFAAKAEAIKAELDDLLARLTLHWNRASDDLDPPTTRFSTRMSR